MAEPLLTQVFGPGATQTATTVTILKADLQTVGLTPSATNTAESLYVALLLLAGLYLTETNLNNNPEQQIFISDGQEFVTTRNTQQYRQLVKNVNMQEIYNGLMIDPDNF